MHSFFRFAALREPGHAALIQRVLAIPPKRCERTLITFLTRPEIDALLAAPDRSGWIGRRDHALLLTAIQTGLRVSELTQLRCQDAATRRRRPSALPRQGPQRPDHPADHANRRRAPHLATRARRTPADPLFPTRRGGPLSRDAVEFLLTKHAVMAAQRCPSLRGRKLSPHVLRHTYGYLYCPGVCELREFCGVTRRCLRNIRYFEARQLHS